MHTAVEIWMSDFDMNMSIMMMACIEIRSNHEIMILRMNVRSLTTVLKVQR